LKKAEVTEKKKEPAAPGNDVAAILMRRAALEMSDSESGKSRIFFFYFYSYF